MAKDTNIALRNQVLYSVFVRDHTEEGTFAALEKDLDRIRALGTDIIWLMPIHPIGREARKGKDGSPYAIRDYRDVNPEYGTREEFCHLVDAIHARGMKCIIDVVYNHTSPDSWLKEHHPEWFFHKPDGSFGNQVADWGDIIDLDYKNNPDLWDYQIDTLKMWASIVDGFRCDVAPLVPVEFWERARAEVETVRPGCIWLAESVDPPFIKENRDHGVYAASDCEVYRAFDMEYDYDMKEYYLGYIKKTIPLSRYVEMLLHQEMIYPQNYVKMRHLENHDNPRARDLIPEIPQLQNWTAFMYFLRGSLLLYGGQEKAVAHLPDLFNGDVVPWNGEDTVDLTGLLQSLYPIKHDPILADGVVEMKAHDEEDTAVIVYRKDGRTCVGVFSLMAKNADVPVPAPDGTYQNRIDGSDVVVKDGKLLGSGRPVIFDC